MNSSTRIRLGILVFAVFAAITWAISSNGLQAQPIDQPSPADFTVQVSESVKPKLSILVSEMPTSITPRLNREINPIKNPGLFLADMGMTGTNTHIQDALVNKGVNQRYTPLPLMTFEGQGNFGAVSPPDTTGDVGPNHYVQMVNSSYAIYDKSGVLLVGPLNNNTLWTGQGGRCETDNSGDPIVLYDDMADRWLLTQFAVGGTPETMCLAVSTTPDPTGTYHLYEFAMPAFPDYPKLGVWPDGYYMGTNTGFANQYYAHVFDRASMLTGAVASHQYVGGLPNFPMPADADGQTPPPTGAPGTFYTHLKSGYANHPAGVDRLALYEFAVDWVTPGNSTFGLITELPIAAFNYTVCGFFAGDCIPQPGTTQKLDSVSPWPMARLQYRNFGGYETMVGNFTVDVDGSDWAGIRWFELQRSGVVPWSLHQEGTFAPDADHRWMGSMAMDGSGNMALGYSVSSASTFPSLRYATRLLTDPLGTLQAESTLYPGGGSQNGGTVDRWGDYSAMVVDPVDNCTFWYTNEYHDVNDGGFNWNTRIGSFIVPGCTGSLEHTGTLTGLVDDGSTDIPSAIVAAQNITGTTNATADANGYYTMTLPVGAYNASASAYGYVPSAIAPVTIVSGTTTVQNFTLVPAPMHTVDGVVTDVNTGWPLYVSIDISGAGYPGLTIWTNPETGAYSIDLVGGTTYTFDVNAWVAGYTPESRAVGPLVGNATENFALVTDSATCTAPGYALSHAYAENFETADGSFTHGGTQDEWEWGSPTGWPNGCAEGVNCWGTDLDGTYNNSTNNWLQSPIINLAGMSGQSTTLAWQQAWNIESSTWDHAYAEITLDGGATWLAMWSHSAGTVTEDWQELNYAFTVPGSEQIQIRWRFTSDSSVAYQGVYIDFITIGIGACLPPANGGLIVGNVYDGNTFGVLNGATVDNEDGYTVVTAATPLDANVDDGFYTVFSLSGGKVHTATLTAYGSDVETVPVLSGATIRQDFYLPAPSISVDPTSLEITLVQGYSGTLNLDIENTGAMLSTFSLSEIEGGFTAASLVPVYMPPATSAATSNSLSQHTSANVGGNRVVDNMVPTQNILLDQPPNQASGIFSDEGCDICGSGTQVIAENFTMSAPTTIEQIVLWGGYYSTDTPIATDSITVIFHDDAGGLPGAAFYTEADVAYSRVQTGVTLYGVNEWMHTLTLASPVALGSGNYWVEIYNNTGFGTDDFFWETGTLDATNGLAGSAWASVAPGSGWNFDATQDLAIQLVEAPPEIPWLSEDPITGTVSALSTVSIDVTFDTMTYTVGTYTGTLRVESDDPITDTIDIPVTMHVITSTTAVLSMDSNWNLIGLPLQPLSPLLAQDLLDDLNGQGLACTEVDRWLSGGWDSHIDGLPFNNFPIEVGEGYFVTCNNAGSWTMQGYALSSCVTISLQASWNLLSVPYPSGYLAQSLLDGINGQGGACTEVDRWLSGGWDSHIDGLPFNNFPIEGDKGYFVSCSSASSFTP